MQKTIYFLLIFTLQHDTSCPTAAVGRRFEAEKGKTGDRIFGARFRGETSRRIARPGGKRPGLTTARLSANAFSALFVVSSVKSAIRRGQPTTTETGCDRRPNDGGN